MNHYKPYDVTKLEVGLTTRCNGHCRFCHRVLTEFKDTIDLPKWVLYKLIDEINMNNNLEYINFIGSRGESIFHPEFLDIIKLIHSNYPSIKLVMHTNGSIHDYKWWKQLASFMHVIYFGLDGLGETNKLYRLKHGDIILENMKGFIAGGGEAIWQFILFKHNEHQVEEAKKLAKYIGCREFLLINSRMYDDILERPSTNDKTKSELNKIFNKTKRPVVCKSRKRGLVYINSLGELWICNQKNCSTQHELYRKGKGLDYGIDFVDIYLRNKDNIQVRTNNYRDIMSSEYYQNVLENLNHHANCRKYCTLSPRVVEVLNRRSYSFE